MWGSPWVTGSSSYQMGVSPQLQQWLSFTEILELGTPKMILNQRLSILPVQLQASLNAGNPVAVMDHCLCLHSHTCSLRKRGVLWEVCWVAPSLRGAVNVCKETDYKDADGGDVDDGNLIDLNEQCKDISSKTERSPNDEVPSKKNIENKISKWMQQNGEGNVMSA